MIPINLQVKESAYDKIVYLLSNLKDDVIFSIEKNDQAIKIDKKKLKQIKTLERLATLDKLVSQSNNSITATREIATNTNGMSNDIS
jgi:hypothetical protein